MQIWRERASCGAEIIPSDESPQMARDKLAEVVSQDQEAIKHASES